MRETDAIGEIYDAAVARGGWSAIPAIFTEVLSSDSAVVTLAEPDRPVAGATHGLAEEALRSYAEYYHHVDPWFAAGRAHLPPFRAALSTDLVPERQFVETEFYADFAKGHGTVQAVGGYVPLGLQSLCTIAVHRAPRSPPFEKADATRLGRLLPHLQRAMLLRQRMGEQAGAIGFAALDALAVGAVICDAAGRVLFANAAAEAACAGGAGLVLGAAARGIEALRPGEGRRLAALIADAASGGPGGGLAVGGPDEARLLVLVTPLPSSFAGEPGRALVTLRGENARPTFGHATLGRLFGLTPAEAALALALLSGDPLAAIARDRGVSENTARSQLSQVLRKTGTSNQRDLVRVLSLIPALRG